MKGAQTLLAESVGIMREAGNTGDQKMTGCIYSEALGRPREIADRPGIAIATGNLALIELVEGDLRA